LLSDLGLDSLAYAFKNRDVKTINKTFSGEPSREAVKVFNRQFITGTPVATT